MHHAKKTTLNKVVFALEEFTQVRETNINNHNQRGTLAILGEHSPKGGIHSSCGGGHVHKVAGDL